MGIKMVAPQTITFEHPLNERIRTFLRTEHLFQLAKYRLNHMNSPWDSRDCVITIIDLYALIERTELRSELFKEIERHINNFQRLANTPSVDHRALEKIVGELEMSSERLMNFPSKQGLFPLECELLNSVRQRLMIPEGTCGFDIPAFHYWSNSSERNKQALILQCLEQLEPLEKTLQLVMSLTRQSKTGLRAVAEGGTFQKSLSTQGTSQLIRVHLRSDIGVFPEISANKMRVNIRFLMASENAKSTLATLDVPFEMECCAI